jgi:hypothetical protein
MGAPIAVIGWELQRSLEADEVAKYLEGLAVHVRQGHLLGFDLKWLAGSEQLESKVLPVHPAKYINIDFTKEGDHAKDADVCSDANGPGGVAPGK